MPNNIIQKSNPTYRDLYDAFHNPERWMGKYSGFGEEPVSVDSDPDDENIMLIFVDNINIPKTVNSKEHLADAIELILDPNKDQLIVRTMRDSKKGMLSLNKHISSLDIQIEGLGFPIFWEFIGKGNHSIHDYLIKMYREMTE